jgi:ribosome-associated translation inhibitor RaiA
MQIQISTDHNIKGSPEFLTETQKFEEIVLDALKNFQEIITRVEVYFTDVNAGKSGHEAKRCLIEARVSGIKSLIATNNANNLLEALEGATEKLRSSLDHTMGKIRNH